MNLDSFVGGSFLFDVCWLIGELVLNTAMMVCYDDGMHSVHYKHGTTSSGTLGQEAGTQIMSLIIFEFFFDSNIIRIE